MKSSIEGVKQFLQSRPEEVQRTLVQPNRQPSAQPAEQYWAQPYDERYLVLTFPDVDFKPTDLLALTHRAEIDDEGTDDVLDFIEARQLRGRTWLTRCALSRLDPSEDVYLHFYFVGDAGSAGPRVEHTSSKVFSAREALPSAPSPETIDGVVTAPHSRIAPNEIPHPENIPTAAPSALRDPAHARSMALGAPDAALPFTKIFVSFDGLTYPQLNCYGVAGAAQKWDYLALYNENPTSPTDHYKNGFCYVSDLTENLYYNFAIWARTWGGNWTNKKWHNDSFWTLDLVTASKLRTWYVRWENNAWVRLGDVVPFKASFASWMKDTVADIGSRKLHQIAIPGTHDSGCFDLYAKATTAEFSQAQNLNFPGQLGYGVRYFDLRLYIANDGGYYFNHAATRTYTKVEDFVTALEDFLGQAGNQEIVVADFSRFGDSIGSDFQPSDYEKIFKLFTTSAVLGPLLANGAHLTENISNLMALGKRLVLLCDKCREPWFVEIMTRLGFSAYDSINIHAEWPDTSKLGVLRTKMEHQVQRHVGFTNLWALQAQLTPIPLLQTMYGAATTCNAVTAKWIHDDWPHDVNIVMCDFISGGGLVEVLIGCNKGRPPLPA